MPRRSKYRMSQISACLNLLGSILASVSFQGSSTRFSLVFEKRPRCFSVLETVPYLQCAEPLTSHYPYPIWALLSSPAPLPRSGSNNNWRTKGGVDYPVSRGLRVRLDSRRAFQDGACSYRCIRKKENWSLRASLR